MIDDGNFIIVSKSMILRYNKFKIVFNVLSYMAKDFWKLISNTTLYLYLLSEVISNFIYCLRRNVYKVTMKRNLFIESNIHEKN